MKGENSETRFVKTQRIIEIVKAHLTLWTIVTMVDDEVSKRARFSFIDDAVALGVYILLKAFELIKKVNVGFYQDP